MIRKPFLMLYFAFAISVLFPACDDDNPAPVEQELITTVELTLTGGSDSVTYKFSDTDGPGGQAPTVDSLIIPTVGTWNLTVRFLDESKPNNAVDITEEVKELSKEHLVCYAVTGPLSSPVITDTDQSGVLPLGLTATLEATSTGTGSFRLFLKHLPDKNAADSCVTGETDVDVTFPVEIR